MPGKDAKSMGTGTAAPWTEVNLRYGNAPLNSNPSSGHRRPTPGRPARGSTRPLRTPPTGSKPGSSGAIRGSSLPNIPTVAIFATLQLAVLASTRKRAQAWAKPDVTQSYTCLTENICIASNYWARSEERGQAAFS